MKKLYTFRRILSAAVLLMMSTLLGAHDFEAGEIYYNIISNTEVEVTYRDYYQVGPYSGSIDIPSSVTYAGQIYSVTVIGDSAFANSSITDITIPNSVKSIGNKAFWYCFNLTEVIIPNSVMAIGNEAFLSCEITEMTIPNSVKTIGERAFSGCFLIASINVAEDNEYYDSREGCNAIIETRTNTLIAGCANTVIPNSVKTIGSSAFEYCISLTEITIPNNVTTIRDKAFQNCFNLTYIEIPNSVKTIGYRAFLGCSNLTEIKIPNSVTSIEDAAFASCSKLKKIIIPDGITIIGKSLLEYCSSLTDVTLPNSVTTIGDAAFARCSSLTEIIIPEQVETIGSYAFLECPSLTSIISLNHIPPMIRPNTFESNMYGEAILYIKEGSKLIYSLDYDWGKFRNIQEGIPSTIIKIAVGEKNESNTPYYTTDGKQVDSPTKKGIYIKNGKKVVIK